MTRKLLFMLIALALGICPKQAAAKSYSVSDLHLRVEVNSGGEMFVEEEITYDFSGSFSFAYRDIPLKSGESVSDVVVSETGRSFTNTTNKQPRTFFTTKSDSTVRVTWYFDASNVTRTFELDYKVSGVIQRYSDVAVLYFKFIGDDWDRVAIQPDASVEASSRERTDHLFSFCVTEVPFGARALFFSIKQTKKRIFCDSLRFFLLKQKMRWEFIFLVHQIQKGS